MAKYKVGDAVTVRSDLIGDTKYGRQSCIREMIKYIGSTREIISMHHDGESYILKDCDGWFWTDEMLEDIEILDNAFKTKKDDYIEHQYGIKNEDEYRITYRKVFTPKYENQYTDNARFNHIKGIIENFCPTAEVAIRTIDGLYIIPYHSLVYMERILDK